jgi:hypothetical protein
MLQHLLHRLLEWAERGTSAAIFEVAVAGWRQSEGEQPPGPAGGVTASCVLRPLFPLPPADIFCDISLLAATAASPLAVAIDLVAVVLCKEP